MAMSENNWYIKAAKNPIDCLFLGIQLFSVQYKKPHDMMIHLKLDYYTKLVGLFSKFSFKIMFGKCVTIVI